MLDIIIFVLSECIPGTFGEECVLTCDSCMNGARCNETRNGCTCTPGWKGIVCNETCDKVTYNVSFNCILCNSGRKAHMQVGRLFTLRL